MPPFTCAAADCQVLCDSSQSSYCLFCPADFEHTLKKNASVFHCSQHLAQHCSLISAHAGVCHQHQSSLDQLKDELAITWGEAFFMVEEMDADLQQMWRRQFHQALSQWRWQSYCGGVRP